MTPLEQLSPEVLAWLGTFSVILSAVSLYLFLCAAMLRLGRRIRFPALGTAVFCCTLMQALGDLLKPSPRLSPFARLFRSLPCVGAAALLFLLFAAETAITFLLIREQKKRLTPGAVKETLDALPDGIGFFASDGQPLLVNLQMSRLCSVYTGAGLLNGNHYWEKLRAEETPPGIRRIRSAPTVTLAAENGAVWDFRRRLIRVSGEDVWELIACDVTEQYRLNRELTRKNERLNLIGERLRTFSRDMETVTREREILAAKVRVHDDVGRSLLALRTYLAKPQEQRSRHSLLPLWQYTVTVMRHEAAPPDDGWESALRDASNVGVHIVQTGELPVNVPANQSLRAILATALRECVSNTVKHAHGTTLYVRLSGGAGTVTADFTNDGDAPPGPIRESGGLKNLRTAVELNGGIMLTACAPRFILRLEMPETEGMSWQRSAC